MAGGTAHSSVQATVRQGTRPRASGGEWAAATTASGSSRSGKTQRGTDVVTPATAKDAAPPPAATARGGEAGARRRPRAAGPEAAPYPNTRAAARGGARRPKHRHRQQGQDQHYLDRKRGRTDGGTDAVELLPRRPPV